MKLLSIGNAYQSSKVEHTGFRSSQSALDFDGVIWDPDTTLSEYQRDYINGTYLGRPSLSDNDSIQFTSDAARRRLEFQHMLALGRPIVIFTPTPNTFYVHTGEVRTSGTGRNAQRTRIVTQTSAVAASPITLKTTEALGEKMEVRGSDAFRRFWDRNRDVLYYRATINSTLEEPVFYVAGTQRLIGGVHRVGPGICLMLPSLNVPSHYSRQRVGGLDRRFVDSLIELLEELGRSPQDVSLPNWTERFLLPDEPLALEQLAKLTTQREALDRRIAAQTEELASLRRYKALLTSSGNILEQLVSSVFVELGCTVEPGAPGRDDLIVKHGSNVAVVEVKGVSKSAAEKHAAQLEKWVSEYFATHGVQPKGILVVNTFRDLPLDQRTESSFPPQMVPYSERREHCLITSGQLLGLLFDKNHNPEARSQMFGALFSTVGIYPYYTDWREFLSLSGGNPDT